MQTLDKFIVEVADKLVDFREDYLTLNATSPEAYPCERSDGFWEDFVIFIDQDVPKEES